MGGAGLLDVAVVGYLLVLRKVARRERLAARRQPEPRPGRRSAHRRAPGAARGGPRDRGAGGPAEPARTPACRWLRCTSSRWAVVVARAPAPVGWQQSAVVGLDDDDIGFADIDEYEPRRVANA